VVAAEILVALVTADIGKAEHVDTLLRLLVLLTALKRRKRRAVGLVLLD